MKVDKKSEWKWKYDGRRIVFAGSRIIIMSRFNLDCLENLRLWDSFCDGKTDLGGSWGDLAV
jgi:hypothetical protein